MAYLPPEVPTLDELVEMAEDKRPSLGNAVSEGELTIAEALEIAEHWHGGEPVAQESDRWRVEIRQPSIITGETVRHCEHEHRSFDEALVCQEERTNEGWINAFVYKTGELNNRLIKSWREPDA